MNRRQLIKSLLSVAGAVVAAPLMKLLPVKEVKPEPTVLLGGYWGYGNDYSVLTLTSLRKACDIISARKDIIEMQTIFLHPSQVKDFKALQLKYLNDDMYPVYEMSDIPNTKYSTVICLERKQYESSDKHGIFYGREG